MQRRQAFSAMAGASAAALLGLPARAAAASIPPLPDPALHKSDPEKYWRRIRDEQFYLPPSRAFLNNGSLGVAPRPVLKAVAEYLENSAALTIPEYEYPRWGYEMMDGHRQEVADFVGCRKDDLAFTHNATEALSTIAAGLDLKPGDEVLMTNQEHGSGKAGWALKKARYGIETREAELPLPPKSPEQYADVLLSAIGPRTRVLFFSGILSSTGLVMPMAEICKVARTKGLITVVDGAHVNGQIPIRIDQIGCDFYAGSPHKWMFAPAGCGILWGREEMLDRLWPSIVTGGWDDKAKKAARFMFVGTNNRAIIEGMVAGVRFANAIGADRIYQRIHQLARRARQQAAEMDIPVITPDDDRMYGSLVSLDMTAFDLEKLMAEFTKRKIWVVRGTRLRLSAHIHTRPQDLDAFFAVVKQVRG
ncbi:MAG: aminotransferase class V-fold PLP-dependent enzyme [Bryobacterales bacterium]|nr:aminotransferase class V-fold PLP-dependent enzyme [Bryobacterales bacterium]